MKPNTRTLTSRNKREGRYAGFRRLLIIDKHQRVGPDANESGLWSLKDKTSKWYRIRWPQLKDL